MSKNPITALLGPVSDQEYLERIGVIQPLPEAALPNSGDIDAGCTGVQPMSPHQRKQQFIARGESIGRWADENNFRRPDVYRVLNGRSPAMRGALHEIAVKLGIKPLCADEVVPRDAQLMAVGEGCPQQRAGRSEFEQKALRLKQVLRVTTDKEAASLLGLSQVAWVGRKNRGNFPETELYALVGKRPELNLDVDYVLTGVGLGKPAMSNEQVAQVFSEIFGAGVSK